MAPEKKKQGSIAGARGSTAGDVYHELWALRAALGLLMPKTELQAVTVEGVGSPTAGEDRYAAVDCGLFYGGKSIPTATAIELVQLRYSTSKPTHHWTVARLTASDANSKDNSVIRGLATSFVDANEKKSAHKAASSLIRYSLAEMAAELAKKDKKWAEIAKSMSPRDYDMEIIFTTYSEKETLIDKNGRLKKREIEDIETMIGRLELLEKRAPVVRAHLEAKLKAAKKKS
jgi:hypothetical protein